VLRSGRASTFGTFRCGSLRDRFSQIDMLHVDVWWRGLNVLVDPGSYQYNAAPRWHEHFMRTASHNTVVVDGRDQMLHHRQFKVLYWTHARLLQFTDTERWALAAGEHSGYRRHPGRCVHRRVVLLVKDDLWVVADRIEGVGHHSARLQWLGGEFPWTDAPQGNGMDLRTPVGDFSVRVLDRDGAPLPADIVAGGDHPPRGWLSRYYGEKVPVPSLVARVDGRAPLGLVSILAGAPYECAVEGRHWQIRTSAANVSFDLCDTGIESVGVQR
jgi:asparagine synthase (glutamine-hydrolysing)